MSARRRSRAWSLPLLAAIAAGFGGCELPEVRGRVVDRDSGAGVADAIVIEQWREAGWMGEPARVERARTAITDAAGRFAIPAARTAGLDARGDDHAPVYVLVHPEYGLVRAGEVAPANGEIRLEVSSEDAAARQALVALCETAPREPWERDLAARVCRRR